MEKASFKMQFRGEGFGEKLTNKDDKHQQKPNQQIITEMSGPGEFKFFSILKLFLGKRIFILHKNLVIIQRPN